MAGGVQIWPPSPHVVMASPPIKSSFDESKPSLPQVNGKLQTLKEPSTSISSLEDGEIPPLLASIVPSSSCPLPNNLTQKSSKVTRWSRRFRPLTWQLSSLYQSLKENLVFYLKASRRKPSSTTISLC
ncbi:hypothetical protein LIER_36464 [Lithospermum erythrorhizon]|uniref:Uncharacterized protein n=1 Tax=Lithospermum erythrorhizon TaxID=34254 RepID=A0AAV3P7P6_LITER